MSERGSVKRVVATGLAITAALTAATSSASAGTLGSVSIPGSLKECSALAVFVNTTTGPGDPTYALPAGGGRIATWSTAAAFPAKPGAAVALIVVRRMTNGTFTVVATDRQTLPTPLPADGVATFSPKGTVIAEAGDLIGLLGYGDTSVCSVRPEAGTDAVLTLGGWTVPPAVGSWFRPSIGAPGSLVAVAATFDQLQDAAVSGAAIPGSIVAGRIATYAFTLTNRGAFTGPITASATVPAGLTVLSALVGTGNCSVAGQTVTCTTGPVGTGVSVPLTIIVRADRPGTYAVSATASVIGSETAPGDNTAGATLTVTPIPVAAAPTAAACRPVSLKGLSLTLAKRVITAVNCRVGKVTKAASKTVKKGLVISTSPRAGKTLANGTKINIVRSSGPRKANKRPKGNAS